MILCVYVCACVHMNVCESPTEQLVNIVLLQTNTSRIKTRTKTEMKFYYFSFYLFFSHTIHPDHSLPSLHSSNFPPLPFSLPWNHCSSVSLQKRSGFAGISTKYGTDPFRLHNCLFSLCEPLRAPLSWFFGPFCCGV